MMLKSLNVGLKCAPPRRDYWTLPDVDDMQWTATQFRSKLLAAYAEMGDTGLAEGWLWLSAYESLTPQQQSDVRRLIAWERVEDFEPQPKPFEPSMPLTASVRRRKPSAADTDRTDQ